MIYGKILEKYRKNMWKIWPKWAHNGPSGASGTSSQPQFEAVWAPQDLPGPQKCQKSVKKTGWPSFLDTSFFPYKIVVVVLLRVYNIYIYMYIGFLQIFWLIFHWFIDGFLNGFYKFWEFRARQNPPEKWFSFFSRSGSSELGGDLQKDGTVEGIN